MKRYSLARERSILVLHSHSRLCTHDGDARAARVGQTEWQQALERVLVAPTPCVMCAETLWWRCHRRLIAELLAARGHEVVHLIRPHEHRPHSPSEEADYRAGALYLCGELVA